MGLFVAAVPELVEENRENKAREKKKDGEKKTEVVGKEKKNKRGWMRQRRKELMFKSY